MAGATGPTGPVGHYGYTSPDYIGPTGIPGATGATGAGTALMPPSANTWTPRINDGLHPEASIAYFKSFQATPIKVTKVNLHAHPQWRSKP